MADDKEKHEKELPINRLRRMVRRQWALTAAASSPRRSNRPKAEPGSPKDRLAQSNRRLERFSHHDSDDESGGTAIRLERGQRFPPHQDLVLLPDAVQETLRRTALGVIDRCLLPPVTMRLRKAARRKMFELLQSQHPSIAPPSAGVLSSLNCFSRCDGVPNILDHLEPKLFSEGDALVYRGEPCKTGVYVLVFGVVDASLPAEGERGGRGQGGGGKKEEIDRAAARGHNAAPGSIVGDCNLATRQPQRKTIRCVSSECCCYHISFTAYEHFLDRQSAATVAHVNEMATTTRLAGMKQAFAHMLIPGTLRKYREFKTFPTATITSIAGKFSPKVAKKDQRIYSSGEPAMSLFVLLNGTVCLEPQEGDERPLEVLKAPCVFGGMSWVQNINRTTHAVALEPCDLFVCQRELLKTELADCPKESIPHLVVGDGDVTMLRHLSYARRIPLLSLYRTANGKSIPDRVYEELATAFKLHIYAAGTTLFGTADDCDRLIVPLSGKARLLPENRPVVLGECLGYPLLCAHRWTKRCVVTQSMEALEIPYDVYSSILARHGAMKQMQRLSTALLHPDRETDEGIREQVRDIALHLENPALHPVTLVEPPVPEAECRKPTEKMLKRLPPIPLRTGMSVSVFAAASKTRVISASAGEETASSPEKVLNGPRGVPASLLAKNAVVQPLILGRHKHEVLRYRQRPPANAVGMGNAVPTRLPSMAPKAATPPV